MNTIILSTMLICSSYMLSTSLNNINDMYLNDKFYYNIIILNSSSIIYCSLTLIYINMKIK